jgi:formyltetrahydrofolate hydrolase
MAVEHEQESWFWLRKHTNPELIILAKSIQVIKDRIEENHNDVHAIHKDL